MYHFFYLYSHRDPEEWVGWKNVKEAFVFFTIRSLFKAHNTLIINVICIFLISIILISLVFIVFFQRNCLVDLCSGDRYWLEIGELRRGLRGGGVQWRGGLGGCRQPAGETRGDLNIEEIKSGWGIGREVSPCFLWRREWAEGGETPPVGVCGGEACSCDRLEQCAKWVPWEAGSAGEGAALSVKGEEGGGGTAGWSPYTAHLGHHIHTHAFLGHYIHFH